MTFDLAFAVSILPSIAAAAVTTLWVTLLASLLAVVVGFCLEMLRRSHGTAVPIVGLIVDFLRLSPILPQIYFLYFVLPFYGIRLSALLVGVLALGLHYSGLTAEVFKAGISAIPRGQIEGATALGLRRMQIIRLIVAPQLARIVAPPLANYVLSILKSTPYLSVIAVPEMLGVALDHASETFRYAEPMAAVGLLFLIFCLLAAHIVHRLADHGGDDERARQAPPIQ